MAELQKTRGPVTHPPSHRALTWHTCRNNPATPGHTTLDLPHLTAFETKASQKPGGVPNSIHALLG